MPNNYSVFGNPIAHSLSPAIHQLFAEQTGIPLVYTKQHIELDGFEEAVKAFFLSDGKGLNITVPFKQEAWALASELSERATLAGAANTLWQNDALKLCADNTDGAGLVSDILERNDWQIENKNVLIVGAGGATRGAILPLLKEKPLQLTIVNRTVEKALQLRDIFDHYGCIKACSFEALTGQHFDLIINATSASINGELPALPIDVIHSSTQVYDMFYAKEPTRFMHWCKKLGAAAVCDGLGMLVGQAAESFFIWHGIRPDVVAVVQSLRQRQ